MSVRLPCKRKRTFLAVALLSGMATSCGGDDGAPPPSPAGGGPGPIEEEERRGRAPIPIPPNTSLVVATVLDVSVAAASPTVRTHASFGPPVSSYALKIKVVDSQPGQAGQNSLAVTGTTYTVYSQVPVDAQLKNGQINAMLMLNGTSYEVWWEISQIVPHP